MKKTYLVVGLGRFGSAVAQRLYELGSEVMAVDLHPELVQKMESKVTCAAVCDARDEDALRALGARNYDCAVVAIGGDLATSVVATLNLKELGVQTVVCKATDETQRRALEKIGADRVVVPERESGIKLAQSLTSSSILDFIELSPTAASPSCRRRPNGAARASGSWISAQNTGSTSLPCVRMARSTSRSTPTGRSMTSSLSSFWARTTVWRG